MKPLNILRRTIIENNGRETKRESEGRRESLAKNGNGLFNLRNIEEIKTVINLLICIAMATYSSAKRGTSSDGEVANSNDPVFCADSLVGNELISLYPFMLYDKPDGNLTY